MLLQNAGCGKSGLKTVRGAVTKDLAEASLCAADRRWLGIVWQQIQETLHLGRRGIPSNQPPLCRREDSEWWRAAHAWVLAGLGVRCLDVKVPAQHRHAITAKLESKAGPGTFGDDFGKPRPGYFVALFQQKQAMIPCCQSRVGTGPQ